MYVFWLRNIKWKNIHLGEYLKVVHIKDRENF